MISDGRSVHPLFLTMDYGQNLHSMEKWSQESKKAFDTATFEVQLFLVNTVVVMIRIRFGTRRRLPFVFATTPPWHELLARFCVVNGAPFLVNDVLHDRELFPA